MVIFLLIALSAVLFDALHDSSDIKVKNDMHQTSSQQIEASDVLFNNPVSNFKLKTGTDKLLSKLIFTGSRNEFLTQYHNFRTFHLLKAESINKRLPFILTSHFMKFNFCHHSSPDGSSLSA